MVKLTKCSVNITKYISKTIQLRSVPDTYCSE